MIKKGDFIKIHYTGKLQDGTIFDTTNGEVAKKVHLSGTRQFKPAIICIGERMLIPGLDDAMVGKTGNFSVTLAPEHAFGKKDPKLLRIIPTTQLHKQQIKPVPGLQLNIDGNHGVVRTTSSGRTVVDFNHPLANQEITYDVEIIGKVEDKHEQIRALLDPLHIPYEEVKVEGTNALIKLPQLLPQPIMQALQERITQHTGLKTVSFEQGNRKQAA
jgi:FKBP-type peptidyl-prolyl cis-trans isomerase 2